MRTCETRSAIASAERRETYSEVGSIGYSTGVALTGGMHPAGITGAPAKGRLSMLVLGTEQFERRIWVNGYPKSLQSAKPTLRKYREEVAESARHVFPQPLQSDQIEVEVVFPARPGRPDADNVVKPIVDALKGIVYEDDIQVVSAKGTVIPVSDVLRSDNGTPHNTFAQLFDKDQFFVRIKIRHERQIFSEIRST